MAVSQLTRPAATPETHSDAAELGALLREAREALKRELPDISDELRIKLAYLQAIEDGRLGDLPGPAYAVGFLRGYANFLGLDGEDIVNRFKAVGAVRGDRTELHLPSPVADGRLPSGFVLLVGAVLAICAYGAWYYASGADKDGEEKVALVPPRIAESVGTVQARPAPDRSPPEAPPVASVPPLVPAPARTESAEPAIQIAPLTPPPAPSGTVATPRAAADAKPIAPAASTPPRNGADARPPQNSGSGPMTAPAAPATPRPGAEAKPPQPTAQTASRPSAAPAAVPASVPPTPEPSRQTREATAPTTAATVASRGVDAIGPAAQSATASRGVPAGSPPALAAPDAPSGNPNIASAVTPVQGGSLPWLAPSDGPTVTPEAPEQTPATRSSDRPTAGRAAETGDRSESASSRAESTATRPDRSAAVRPRAAEAGSPALQTTGARPPAAANEPGPASGPSGAAAPQVAAEQQAAPDESDPSGSITTLQSSDGQVAIGRVGEAARRILIEAKVDTWIEVRRGGGSPVFSRLMRAGETFEVPPQAGYRLSTGNAAGIDVSIDGQRLAPLGKSGAVRRNVVLDADTLLRTPGVAP